MRCAEGRHAIDGPVWEVRGQLHHYDPEAAVHPPLREQLGVFSRPPAQADQVPVEIVSTVRSLDEGRAAFEVPEEEIIWPEPSRAERLPLVGRLFRRTVEPDPEMKALLEEMSRKAYEDEGSHLIDEARLLLSFDKQPSGGLYAIPTTTGQVWIYLVQGTPPELRGGHLLRSLPNGIDWQIHSRRGPQEDTRWVAFGLVANEVDRVDLEFLSGIVGAQMGTNAFFFEDEGDPSALVAFVLHLADGSSMRITTEPR